MDIRAIPLSQGWQRRGWAALFGVCATAALPPFYILPLLVPAFAGLFLLAIHARGRGQAFADGWWWGLGHFTAGLYWICISLYVEPEKFAWLTPFTLFGLPSVLAIYTGLVTWLLYICRRRGGLSTPILSLLLFASLWVGVEYLRAHLLTGFPWNLIGYSFAASDVTIQLASVTGVYGLSWVAVMAGALPALFFFGNRALPANIAGVVMLAAMIGFGLWRLETNPTQATPVTIRIVQANIPQSMKWDPKAEMAGLKKHADMTRSPGLDKAQIVLWPETAVPFPMEQGAPLARDLGSLLPPGAILITGGIRGEGDAKHWKAWNSLFVIDGTGKIVTQYDKHHLVPFGEFIPLRHILPVEAIAMGMGDFERGPGPSTLVLPGLAPPVSPLICYEAVFPDEAVDATHRARWLVNVTDDAWFGISTGPYQHLQMARMRAVEQGLPLVRAAGTGISAAFDPLGRTLARLPLAKEGIMDVTLPQPLAQGSIFSRCPYITVLFIIVISVIFALFAL